MQQGNFIDVFLARHISGTYAHHQKHYYYYFIIIINILTAIGLAPGGSSPVHIYREHYIAYTNNTQNT